MTFTIQDNLEDIIKNYSDFNIVIFGGTGGLGRAIATALAASGVRVTVIGQTFRDSDVENIKFIKADLSSIKDSVELAKSIDVSDASVLLFTTGIFASRTKEITKEGLEKDMVVSYLNRLVIIGHLACKLSAKSNFKPRIFVMGIRAMGN